MYLVTIGGMWHNTKFFMKSVEFKIRLGKNTMDKGKKINSHVQGKH